MKLVSTLQVHETERNGTLHRCCGHEGVLSDSGNEMMIACNAAAAATADAIENRAEWHVV